MGAATNDMLLLGYVVLMCHLMGCARHNEINLGQNEHDVCL